MSMRHGAILIRRRSDTSLVVTAPTVAARSSTQILMSWELVAGAVQYVLEKSTDSVTWAAVLTTAGPDRSYVDNNLTAATPYYYRLKVTGVTGATVTSEVLNASTTGDVTPPGTPVAAPDLDGVTATSVTVTGAAITGATSYVWQRSTSATTGFASITGTTLTITDEGRTAATTYYYRYAGVNADGTGGYSPAVAATTNATAVIPAAPAQPTASSIGTQGATLTVAAVTGATSYVWQRSTNATTGFTTLSGTARELVDSGLTAATTYYYRAAASNTAGTSGYSPNRSVTTAAVSSTSITPVSARFVVRHSGVRVAPHENGTDSIYKGANADAIVARTAEMGMTYIRGMFSPSSAALDEWVTALRKYNVQWLMTLIPEGGSSPTTQTVAETRKKVQAIISKKLDDVCYGLEGLNEPNHNRGTGPVPLDWATTAYNHQAAIWDEARNVTGSTLKDVPIVGCSLHDVAADNSYTDANPSGGKFHFHQLVDLGILKVQTMAGMHCYPSGKEPETGLQERLDRMYNAYGTNYPVFVTEWGYSNNTGGGLGNPVTPAVAGVYGPRGFLQFIIGHSMNPERNDVRRGIYQTYFEFGDNYNPAKTEREFNFGMYSVGQASVAASVNPDTWEPKPVSTSVGAMLTAMADPVGTAAYATVPVECTVTTTATNVIWWLTQNKAQAAAETAHLWLVRDAAYSAVSVNVSVTDRVGTRNNIAVGGEVVRVDLR